VEQQKMPDYRAYILGGEGHRFRLAPGFAKDHINDAAALSEAKKLIDNYDVEVWDAGRLVARLDHATGNRIDSFSRPTEEPKLVDKAEAGPAKIVGDPVADAKPAGKVG
jgi:hypothetical protein